ncbi:MAG: 2-amino-4-hydroxy-6-hydroxymethyldihydropteridine diphosphokinase [Alphaproteobacteria bacterium]|nr:2-amino-4-hydroxy-6-hydroxymethyldihydropteridine diphosphokinase [Alphaproteobacteria bacterium]
MSFRGVQPADTLKGALAALEGAGVAVQKVSSFIETLAWPDPNDPPFLNAVASLQTLLQPFALLELLHTVETAFGRVRSHTNAPRTLDLDLLAHGGTVLNHEKLILPHPRLAERRFVLEPLAEIAPAWRHPQSGLTASDMLARLG